MSEISAINSTSDCPYMVTENNVISQKKVKFSFTITPPIHPSGQCCKTIVSKDAQKLIDYNTYMSLSRKEVFNPKWIVQGKYFTSHDF